MTEPAVIVAVITATVAIITAVITVVRFRRKDRADTRQVEEGTISARFKDADALVRYIDDRVDERTATLSAELEKTKTELEGVQASLTTVKRESHEIHDAVRTHFWRLWAWDQKGRPGAMPLLPPRILDRLGITEPLEDTEPVRRETDPPKETS